MPLLRELIALMTFKKCAQDERVEAIGESLRILSVVTSFGGGRSGRSAADEEVRPANFVGLLRLVRLVGLRGKMRIRPLLAQVLPRYFAFFASGAWQAWRAGGLAKGPWRSRLAGRPLCALFRWLYRWTHFKSFRRLRLSGRNWLSRGWGDSWRPRMFHY